MYPPVDPILSNFMEVVLENVNKEASRLYVELLSSPPVG